MTFAGKDNNISNSNKEPNDNNSKDNEIPITDRYAVVVDNFLTNTDKQYIRLYYLENGVLYYLVEEMNSDNTYYMNSFSEIDKSKMQEYKEIKNIKRIKSTNTISSGAAFNLLLITDEGVVYELIQNDISAFKLNVSKDFSSYQVEDIINYEPVNGCVDGMICEPSYELILKDGKTVTKKWFLKLLFYLFKKIEKMYNFAWFFI